MLNVLDIFSGIGGFSIGLEAVGMKTVAFCEINQNTKHQSGHRYEFS